MHYRTYVKRSGEAVRDPFSIRKKKDYLTKNSNHACSMIQNALSKYRRRKTKPLVCCEKNAELTPAWYLKAFTKECNPPCQDSVNGRWIPSSKKAEHMRWIDASETIATNFAEKKALKKRRTDINRKRIRRHSVADPKPALRPQISFLNAHSLNKSARASVSHARTGTAARIDAKRDCRKLWWVSSHWFKNHLQMFFCTAAARQRQSRTKENNAQVRSPHCGEENCALFEDDCSAHEKSTLHTNSHAEKEAALTRTGRRAPLYVRGHELYLEKSAKRCSTSEDTPDTHARRKFAKFS